MSIKVMVVDDSALMRKMITQILEKDPDIEVVGTAINGEFALKKLGYLKPDIITLDIDMPIMDGLQFLEEKKKLKDDTPVVIVSSLTRKGSAITAEALEKGAVDFVTKPSGSVSLDIDVIADELRLKIKNWALKKGIYLDKSIIKTLIEKEGFIKVQNKIPKNPYFIALGISTGGPDALRKILPLLKITTPILIVQHMPAGFTEEFAASLNKIVKNYEVQEVKAKEEKIKRGNIYIAPGDKHIGVKKGQNGFYVFLSDTEPVNNHKPSVDFLFKTIYEERIKNVIAIIMTGMGKDGAFYIAKLRHKGVFTIGQDEETSIVYGMPKVAKELDGIDLELPLMDIPDFLNQHISD